MFNTNVNRVTYSKNALDPKAKVLVMSPPLLLPSSPPLVIDMIRVVDVEQEERDTEEAVQRAVACSSRSTKTWLPTYQCMYLGGWSSGGLLVANTCARKWSGPGRAKAKCQEERISLSIMEVEDNEREMFRERLIPIDCSVRFSGKESLSITLLIKKTVRKESSHCLVHPRPDWPTWLGARVAVPSPPQPFNKWSQLTTYLSWGTFALDSKVVLIS